MGINLNPSDFMDSWPAQVSDDDIAELGNSLRRIDGKWMKSGEVPSGERIWYQGQEAYFNLVVETDDLGIHWFQLTLRGKVLFWHRERKRIQTGETEELDVPPTLAYYAASKTIRDGAQVDEDFVVLGTKILRTRKDDSLLASIANILETAQAV